MIWWRYAQNILNCDKWNLLDQRGFRSSPTKSGIKRNFRERIGIFVVRVCFCGCTSCHSPFDACKTSHFFWGLVQLEIQYSTSKFSKCRNFYTWVPTKFRLVCLDTSNQKFRMGFDLRFTHFFRSLETIGFSFWSKNMKVQSHQSIGKDCNWARELFWYFFCFGCRSIVSTCARCLHVSSKKQPILHRKIRKYDYVVYYIYIYFLKTFFLQSPLLLPSDSEWLLILAWQFCNSTDLPSGSITFQMKTTTHFWPENLEIQVFSFLRRTFWDKRNQGDSDFDMFLELARSIHVDTSG